MRKVVLDTNVLISGVIASGYSAAILDAAQREEIQLVASTHLLEEFSSVISRRHITRKYPKVAENAEALFDFLRAYAILTTGIPTPNAVIPTAMMIMCWLAHWMEMWTVLSLEIHIF